MAIPKDLEGLCRAAAARVARAKAIEEGAEARLAKKAQAAEKRQRDARKLGAEAASTVWEWLKSTEAKQLRALVRRHRLEYVRIFGPVWAETGEKADGVRSGCQALYLVDDEPAVRLEWRVHYMGSGTFLIRSPARLRKLLKPLPLLRFAEAIRSGAVWTGLRKALRRTRK